jgi:SeqA protein N-terminal domain
MEMRSIEIDFEVHKKIEAERNSFAETPNEVLRRLLRLSNVKVAKQMAESAGRSWSGKGVTLPHGSQLRMEYNGRVYTGHIHDGVWLVEGAEFKSPSAAASGVGVTKSGGKTSLDGWIYWQTKRPTDSRWIGINDLRPR